MSDTRTPFRYTVYLLLATVSCSIMLARIVSVESKTVSPKKTHTPFLSANDRSRWCTVRSLVDEGTYAIDSMVKGKDKNWHTIDRVRHRGPDGQQHYFSSKPPLLPTLIAAEYWGLRQLTGTSIAQSPLYVGRILLVTTNLLPLVLYFLLLVRWIERSATTDFGSILVFATATFGTFLTTFSVTINNHLPAAVSVLVAAYCAHRIWYDNRHQLRYFVIAGCGAGFAAANELPALSLLVLLGAGLMWKSPRQTMFGYLPAVILVAIAFFGTNFRAHGDWLPPYAHRTDGKDLHSFDAGAHLVEELEAGKIPDEIRKQLPAPLNKAARELGLRKRYAGTGWELSDKEQGKRYALVQKGDRLKLREWGNWYDFAGSYWTSDLPRGVDLGEKSRKTYALHVLVGHHGIFSLTPVWILSVVGLAMMFGRGLSGQQALACLIFVLTVVCLVFYIGWRPVQDRNYGGVCSGFRWLFWFTPLWLMAMLPAADFFSKNRWLRWFAIVLLMVSVFSATYPWQNPWTHPWLFQYWESLGWITYP